MHTNLHISNLCVFFFAYFTITMNNKYQQSVIFDSRLSKPKSEIYETSPQVDVVEVPVIICEYVVYILMVHLLTSHSFVYKETVVPLFQCIIPAA